MGSFPSFSLGVTVRLKLVSRRWGMRLSAGRAVWTENLTDGVACRQSVEAGVEAVKVDEATAQPVHGKFSLTVQREEPRNVAAGNAASHITALDGSVVADELGDRNIERCFRPWQTGCHDCAAPATHLISRLKGFWNARQFNGKVDATFGHLFDLVNAVPSFAH